ncbi:MAG: hypothetical protein JKY81_01580 [Colwellia sp.]|nr:hypothetical protein [Colwellia sp.]
MTVTTELYLRWTDKESLDGQVVADFLPSGSEISIRTNNGYIDMSFQEMKSLMGALMEVDRAHRINEKCKVN